MDVQRVWELRGAMIGSIVGGAVAFGAAAHNHAPTMRVVLWLAWLSSMLSLAMVWREARQARQEANDDVGVTRGARDVDVREQALRSPVPSVMVADAVATAAMETWLRGAPASSTVPFGDSAVRTITLGAVSLDDASEIWAARHERGDELVGVGRGADISEALWSLQNEPDGCAECAQADGADGEKGSSA